MRRLRLQQPADSRGDVFEFVGFEGEFHPVFAAEGVDEQRKTRAFGLFKQQRHPAWASFWSRLDLRPLNHFHNFENGINFRFDAAQLAFFLQTFYERAQIGVCHLGLRSFSLPGVQRHTLTRRLWRVQSTVDGSETGNLR